MVEGDDRRAAIPRMGVKQAGTNIKERETHNVPRSEQYARNNEEDNTEEMTARNRFF